MFSCSSYDDINKKEPEAEYVERVWMPLRDRHVEFEGWAGPYSGWGAPSTGLTQQFVSRRFFPATPAGIRAGTFCLSARDFSTTDPKKDGLAPACTEATENSLRLSVVQSSKIRDTKARLYQKENSYLYVKHAVL